MLRGEIINLSDRLLQQAFGGSFSDDPFTVADSNGGFVDTASDIVSRLQCFYDVQETSLIAGQSLYASPTIFRIKDLYVVDASAKIWELIVRTPAQMTREIGTYWRTWTSTDPPSYAVFEGDTKVLLAPTPSVTRGDALVFEGFALTTSKTSPVVGSYVVDDPGTGYTFAPDILVGAPPVQYGGTATALATIAGGSLSGVIPVLGGSAYTLGTPPVIVSGGGGTGAQVHAVLATAHLWPNPSDPCPLPEDGQMAVVYKLCELRCAQQAGNPACPQAGAKLQTFAAQYRQEANALERNTMLRANPQRLGPGHRRRGFGAPGIYY